MTPSNFKESWTDADIELLVTMYWSVPRPTHQQMADALGRTIASITGTLSRQGIANASRVTTTTGKMRKCLPGDRQFFSSGIGNRMCRRCKDPESMRQLERA